MQDFLDLDLSKCERRVPHPHTGMMVPVSTLSPEQIEAIDEGIAFDQEIKCLIESNQIKVAGIVGENNFSFS